eukprot:gene26443-34614_t
MNKIFANSLVRRHCKWFSKSKVHFFDSRSLSALTVETLKQQHNQNEKNYFIIAALFVGIAAASCTIDTSYAEPLESTKETLSAIQQSLRSIESHINSQSNGKLAQQSGRIDVVLGAQWGDEGKGKLVDILSPRYHICARVAGGSNAGHTIVVDGKKYKFHLVPSGILNKEVVCVVGNGLVVHLRGLLSELDALRAAGVDYNGRLLLSDRAHIVFDFHQQIDAINEKRLGGKKLGTTHKGIGPAYGSKVMRNGLRIGDLQDLAFFESRLRSLVDQLKSAYPELQVDVEKELAYYKEIRSTLLPMITDTVQYCNTAIAEGKNILVEGANATMIDLDFGTFPFVTSSNPSIGSVCTGLGVPPQRIQEVVGIVKAYCTRVGEGPFPTELSGSLEETLRAKGGEFGTTTGRPRRCGWVDIPQLKYALMLNGSTEINLTKLDVLSGFDEVKIGVGYRSQDGEE